MADRITKIIVNIGHFKYNLDAITSLIPSSTKIMTVLKANAYGHGIEKLATVASDWGVDYIGVASLGEVRKIRAAGVTTPCLILNYLDIDSIPEALALNASVTAMDANFIAALQQCAEKTDATATVHLKIDTGMHRAGCDPQDALELARLITASSHLYLEGVFTHFAESFNVRPEFTNLQLARFTQCIQTLKSGGIAPPLIHSANSAATIAHPDSHFTMVRPGILCHGLNPFLPNHPKYQYVQQMFNPTLSIASQIAFIRHLSPGESVGYGRRWVARRPSTLALIPIGYGDGYRQAPYSAPFMLVNGTQAPVVGSVSMDQTVIDITGISNVSVGDEVIILGTQNGSSITAEDLAASYKTIHYEVMAGLADRLDRVYNEP